MAELFNRNKMFKRIEKAKANKALWEPHIRECYRYAMPNRETITKHSKGAKKNQDVFDDTAVEATAKFASRMQAQVVPPWKKWFNLESGSEIPEEQVEQVDEMLEESADVLFDHINHSNFQTQIVEAFQDVAISTGCIIVEEGDGIRSHLNFRTVPLSEIIVEKTAKGIIGTVWRELETPIADIKEIWPRAEISPKMAKKLEKEQDATVTLVEGVAWEEKKQKFVSMLVSVDEKFVLFEELEDTSPFIVFRESVVAGETLGRGRVMDKLPAIKTLNKMVQYILENAAIQVSGIYTAVDDGILNPYTAQLRPRAILPVGSNDNANPSLRAITPSGNLQFADLLIKDLQYGIKKYLLAEPFGQIDETPVRTAYEMSIRESESQEDQSAASGRVQTELLEPLITRCVDILMKNGKIAPMKVDGKEVTIKFTSPAAKRQDSHELNAMLKFAEASQFIPPEVVHQGIKIEEFPAEIADLVGLPQRLKRNKAERQQLIQKAEQNAMAMAQMQQPQGGQPQ